MPELSYGMFVIEQFSEFSENLPAGIPRYYSTVVYTVNSQKVSDKVKYVKKIFIQLFEILVSSGLQICFQKNHFSALLFQPLPLRKTWDSNLLSLDNVYYTYPNFPGSIPGNSDKMVGPIYNIFVPHKLSKRIQELTVRHRFLKKCTHFELF